MPLRIVRDDLVNLRADAIVLPSNERLSIDGGAGYAVARKAGLFRLRRAVRKVGGCAVGSAVATLAFSFPARYLIHAVGPVWHATEEDARLLRSAYNAALSVAYEKGCESVALPLLSAGTFGCPAHVSLSVALSSIEGFLAEHDVEVTLVLFDKAAMAAGLDFLGEIESRIDDAAVEMSSRSNWAAISEEFGAPAYGVQGHGAPAYGVRGHASPDATVQFEAISIEKDDEWDALPDAGYDAAPDGAWEALLEAGYGAAPAVWESSTDAWEPLPDAGPKYDIWTGRQLRPDDDVEAWRDGFAQASAPAAATPATSAPTAATPATSAPASAAPAQAAQEQPRPLEKARRRFPGLPSFGKRESADADGFIADRDMAEQIDAQAVWREADQPAPPGQPAQSYQPTPPGQPATLEQPAKLDLESRLEQLDEGFSQTLLDLIDESGMTDSEVYRRANMSRQHFSKIRNNVGYRPSKPTVLALCVALELDLEQTNDLLRRAGFALTHASKFDVIVEYFIERGVYNSFTINETLFYFDQQLLG